MDFWSSFIELVVVIVIAASVSSVLRDVLDNWWGILLLVGFVLAGVLIPMVLHGWPHVLGRAAIPTAAVLVIFGSFFLRWGVIMASERV